MTPRGVLVSGDGAARGGTGDWVLTDRRHRRQNGQAPSNLRDLFMFSVWIARKRAENAFKKMEADSY